MSTSPPRTAFITGATGTQGLALSRQLRALNWTVHTTVRNPSAPSAHHLQSLGVVITPGTWDSEPALATSMAGCTHLFLNLMPDLATFTSEVAHAQRILSTAKAAGIRHVVYSSGLSVPDLERRKHHSPDSPVTRVLSWKREVEGLVKTAGFESWTILRGGFFMANFLAPKVGWMYPGLRETGRWVTALTAETRVPVVDTEDIARFAVAAFRDPGRFNGREIGIAGEVLSPGELMRLLSEATGRDLKEVFLTDEEVEERRKTNILVEAQLMSRDLDKFVDLEEVKSWGIPLGTFRQFLEREREALAETYTSSD